MGGDPAISGASPQLLSSNGELTGEFVLGADGW